MPEVHPLRRALPLFLLAGLCLSSLDATAKYLVRDHALFLVVWARYAGQMLVVTPFAWQRAGAGFWRTRHPYLQLLRSAFLLVATICFFGGLRYLPLAEGSAITFLAPIFIIVLSGPLLGERPNRARWFASVAGFIGILILVRPGSAIFHPATLLFVVAAFCNALYYLMTRKLADESAYTTLFYSALAGTVGLSLVLPWYIDAGVLTWREGALFLLLGLFAGLGHWFVISAYLLAPASMLTPFTYLQMVWATGACHGLRAASHVSSRKAVVAATRDLFRGSLNPILAPNDAQITTPAARRAAARPQRRRDGRCARHSSPPPRREGRRCP
ncbi:MAG: DMT family transporter [Pseudomonadota bacterium]|nr:DMT family transporter [Pseudomonadota bacterium]